MGKIIVLSKQTANQIAAGEVVERPASVVKELVENSLDALSTAITIEIKNGGLDYIRVTDNGAGIDADDVNNAFLRNATSKIRDASDLEHIETLGFRGEALASVAAVAKVHMRTRTKDSQMGVSIYIEGGNVTQSTPVGCTEGTTVEVAELFYNVPARLKFAKSRRAEAAQVADFVLRLILANTNVAVKYIQDSRTVYQSAGDGDQKNAIFCVYGSDMLEHLKKVDYDDGYIKFSGFVATESVAKSTRQYQSFFVNRRYIRSQKLSYAISRVFDTRLMSGKFPVCVINIGISSYDIDVNVHPNKLDVRFKDEERVINSFSAACRMALGVQVAPAYKIPPAVKSEFKNVSKCASTPWMSSASNQPKSSEQHSPVPADTASRSREVFDASGVKKAVIVKEPPVQTAVQTHSSPFSDVIGIQKSCDDVLQPTAQSFLIESAHTRETAANEVKPEQVSFGVEPYIIAGKLFECYWIIQQGNDMFFIDQHAAHERRIYEQLMNKGYEARSQILLIPVIIKLTPQEYAILIDNMPEFTSLGFDMDEFGAYTVNIRAVPYMIGEPETAEFIRDAIAELTNGKKLKTEELKRDAIVQAACKHAIKAGEALEKNEIEALLSEYERSGVPMSCPHGRPVMIRMTKTELEKLFKRIV